MSPEELQKVYDDLRQEGHSDEELLVATGQMFEDGKINLEQLKGVCEANGWELDPEFANITDEEEARKHLWKTDPDKADESLSKGQVKDAELDPDGNPAPSDRSGKPDDAGEDKGTDDDEGEDGDNKPAEPESEDGKNDEEKNKAFQLMGIRK